MEKISAEEDLKVRLDLIQSIEGKKSTSIDAVIARNILHEELGYFTDSQTEYVLDEPTRNRLIVHIRQDGAHALLAILRVNRALSEVARLLKLVVVLLSFLSGATVLYLFL